MPTLSAAEQFVVKEGRAEREETGCTTRYHQHVWGFTHPYSCPSILVTKVNNLGYVCCFIEFAPFNSSHKKARNQRQHTEVQLCA